MARVQRLVQELTRACRSAGEPRRVRSLAQPAETLGLSGCQARGAFVGGGGRGIATALEGSRCGALECGSNLLVRTDGCRGQVPGALLRVTRLAGERFSERGVCGAAFGRGCRVVDRRADERVAERETMSIKADEVNSLSCIQIRELEGQERKCCCGRREFLRVARGRNDECVSRPLAKRGGAAREQALDSGSDLEWIVQRLGTAKLRRREGSRQLDECERVTSRERIEPLGNVRVNARRRSRLE